MRRGEQKNKVLEVVREVRDKNGRSVMRCGVLRDDGQPCYYEQNNFISNNFKRHIVVLHPAMARKLGFEVKKATSKEGERTQTRREGSSREEMDFSSASTPCVSDSDDTMPRYQPVSCCVPGCINKRPKWITKFPRTEPLIACWKAAIEAGTGQCLSDEKDAVICNMHFYERRLPQRVSDDDTYREPSLFFSNNLVLHVLRCQLCLSYESVDNMFSMEDSFADGHSIRWMIKTYFGVSSKKKVFGKGYICEKCAIRVDMTHAFRREVDDASKRQEKLATEMMSVKVKFKHSSSSWMQDAHQKWQEISPTLFGDQCYEEEEDDEDEDMRAATENLFIKEEPQLMESNLQTSLGVTADDRINQLDHITLGCQRETLQEPNHFTESIVEAPVRHVTTKEIPSYTKEIHTTIQEQKELNKAEYPVIKTEKQVKFKCYLCKTAFRSKELRDLHLSNHHNDQDSYCCEECDLSFNRLTSYNIHLSMHQQKIRYRRSVIGGGTNLGRFGQSPHKRYFARKKMFDCETCGKQFIYHMQLQQHRQKHTTSLLPNGMPYATRNGGDNQNLPTCNVCHATFQHSKEIVAHFREAHSDIHLTTYSCMKCTQVFFTTRSAYRHRISHTTAYVCNQCGKGHTSHKSLTKHCQAMHKSLLKETV